jgi:phospholipid/cholesterol/gamma-HCH transport system substrate-binding protein
MSRTARLGAFILFTLLILAVGIFIIGSKQYLFTSTYQLKTRFANVAGLSEGADVLIGGVHSGTVQSINLPDKAGDQVTVVLLLNASTHRIVKQDSVASIETEGLLGSQYVAVSFGSADKPEVKNGDTIGSIPPLQMAALVEKANGLLSQGQTAMVSINQVAAHLNSVTGKIDSGNGTVGELINDKALYNNLNDTASNARAATVSAKAGVSDFADNMEALKHNFLLKGYFKNRGYEDSSDLGKDAIESAPQIPTAQDFTLQAKDLFDKQDSAKLKGQKALNAAGQYLAANDFGLAVIEVSTGKTGSTDADKTLAEGRALVLREYIVQHFGFDDSKLKTIALGKQTGEASKDDWGLVKILIYPAGTAIPPAKSDDATPSQATPVAHQPPSNF